MSYLASIISVSGLSGWPEDHSLPREKPYVSAKANLTLNGGVQLVLRGIRGPHRSDNPEILLSPEATEVFDEAGKRIDYKLEGKPGGALFVTFVDKGVVTRFSFGDGYVTNGMSSLHLTEIGVGKEPRVAPLQVRPHEFNFTHEREPSEAIAKEVEKLNREYKPPKKAVYASPRKGNESKVDLKSSPRRWDDDEIIVRLNIRGKEILPYGYLVTVRFDDPIAGHVVLNGMVIKSKLAIGTSYVHTVVWENASVGGGKEIGLAGNLKSLKVRGLNYEITGALRVPMAYEGILQIKRPATLHGSEGNGKKSVARGAGLLFLASTGLAAWNLYREKGIDSPEFRSLALGTVLGSFDPTFGIASSALTEAISGENFSTIFRNVMNPAHLLSTGLSLTPAGGLLSILAPFLG